MTGEEGIKIDAPQGLVDWLMQRDDTYFPQFDSDKGEKAYRDRYNEFAQALLPIHNNVVNGAMVEGALKWIEETQKIADEQDEAIRNTRLRELQDADPICHLNNHGKGHVDKVIQKASEMLHFFDRGHLTPYEGFFLLCAIQLHDTGNVYGRENHEKEAGRILKEKGKPFITCSFERKVIEKIALAHGGAYDGARDTIRYLSPKKKLYDRDVRKQLLAAMLRFADELADDHSRADLEGLEQNTIMPGGIIYHQYSKALHTVKIKSNIETGATEIDLCYDLDSDIAAKQFQKGKRSVFLLDEIYDRTLKMERERRYCMRYLRPCLSIDRINVNIVIHNANPLRSYEKHEIAYSLEENGYPHSPASGHIRDFDSELRTGEEELNYMREKNWEIGL